MIKEILKYYIDSKNFKFFFIYLFLCLFIYPLENVGMSKLNSKIYPLLGDSKSNKLLYILIGLFIVIYVSKIAKEFVLTNVTPDMIRSMRITFFEQILNKYKKNFENTKNGELLNKLIMVPELFVHEIMKDFIDYIIPESMGIIASCIVLYNVDKSLLKYLAIILSPMIILIVFIKKLSDNKIRYIRSRDKQLNFFGEQINNLFNIYITNTIDENIQKHNRTNINVVDSYRSLITRDYLFIIVCKIIYLIAIVLVINRVKSGFINKNYTYETVILILTNIMLAFKSCISIEISAYFSLRTGVTVKNMMDEILNRNNDGVIKKDFKKVIFDNVSFKYPKTANNILDKMNIEINIGDKFVIFGKSGSGKSTIFKLLMGFFNPTNGKITVNDEDINNLDLGYYRTQFAYVSQDTKLFDMTVMDNIKYSNKASEIEIDNIIQKYNIARVYEKLEHGLNTMAGIDGNNLSGGQKQMVLILRALLKKPKIYLFDEPTAALDPFTREIIYKILKDIEETTIIISHDPKIKEYIPTVYNLIDKKLVK